MPYRIKVRPIPNDAVAEALHHLLHVWETYGKWQVNCMTTGECADDLLASYGLTEGGASWYVGNLTPAGRALMARDFPDPETELIPQ